MSNYNLYSSITSLGIWCLVGGEGEVKSFLISNLIIGWRHLILLSGFLSVKKFLLCHVYVVFASSCRTSPALLSGKCDVTWSFFITKYLPLYQKVLKACESFYFRKCDIHFIWSSVSVLFAIWWCTVSWSLYQKVWRHMPFFEVWCHLELCDKKYDFAWSFEL